jgi:hypothetical protein
MGVRHAAVELGNEVRTTYATQALLYASTLFRLVPEEELTLGELLFGCLGTEHWFERIRVVACVPRLSGIGHGSRGEVLNLLQLEVKTLGDDSKLGHVLFLTAWMGGYEIGNDLLAQTFLAIYAVEDALELIELTERGLAHEVEHTIAGVLRGNLEASTDVMADEFARVFHSSLVAGFILAAMEQQVIAHATAYIAVFDAWQGIDRAIDVEQFGMVGIEVWTYLWVYT